MAVTREERRRLAMAEARQHHPTGEQVVITLEIRHPSFPVDEIPRVVRDNADLVALTETGERVRFIAAAFEITGPAQGESRWPRIDLAVEGVTSQLEKHLDGAIDDTNPIEIIFREYVRSQALDGPSNVLKGLELDRTTAGDLMVRGTAGFFGFDRRYGKTYDPRRFPSVS